MRRRRLSGGAWLGSLRGAFRVFRAEVHFYLRRPCCESGQPQGHAELGPRRRLHARLQGHRHCDELASGCASLGAPIEVPLVRRLPRRGRLLDRLATRLASFALGARGPRLLAGRAQVGRRQLYELVVHYGPLSRRRRRDARDVCLGRGRLPGAAFLQLRVATRRQPGLRLRFQQGLQPSDPGVPGHTLAGPGGAPPVEAHVLVQLCARE
mmetsp:Transcript_64445/g.186789  ORF Transcript_64445/g.186789 Transcript_64445/m.186789 type:complete len:210 (-) Transcript_64445:284-913(-)